MSMVRDLCAAGRYPRHHLWGADALEAAGCDVEYGLFGRDRRWLKALSSRLGDRLGDLEQEAVMLRRAGRGAVLYAGEASLLRGLLRAPVPTVAVVHRAAPWAARLDVAICLSSAVRDALVHRHGRDPGRTPLATWGPDLAFPGYASRQKGQAPLSCVVSAGKTERDTNTLLRALEGTGLAARVYADKTKGTGPFVLGRAEVVPVRPEVPLDYEDVLTDLRAASVVAIPLYASDRLLGLTEINDALALGIPIVMTRTAAVDFDPEAVGCGLTVAPGDVEGWRAALTRLDGDAELRAAMGARGRAFAEAGYNAETFGATVVTAVRDAAG